MKDIFAEMGRIFFETSDKAILEAISGRYPDISTKEILVCWMTCWTLHDFDGYAEYDEVVERLKVARSEGIPETLRKEFHIDGDAGSLLFSSEKEVKRAISQARRHGYIRYKIEEFARGGADMEISDPNLVWHLTILVVFDETLDKEVREVFGQIKFSSVKQFFPSSPAEGDEEDAIDKKSS